MPGGHFWTGGTSGREAPLVGRALLVGTSLLIGNKFRFRGSKDTEVSTMHRVLALSLLAATAAYFVPAAVNSAVVSAQTPTNPSELEKYIGAYELESGTVARIMLRATGLVAEIGAARTVRLKSTSQGVFEAESGDPYRVTFDAAGSQLQIARAASSQSGRRIVVPSDVLGRYAGTYPLSDTLAMVLTLEGGGLIAQATGASRHPLFPESTTRFFVQDSASADVAHLEFGADPDGSAFVVFRQMGGEQKVYRK